MQRHRIPTIFNIYMLDVICCALGCVILLWQVSSMEAERQTVAAKKHSDDALAAKKRYETAERELLNSDRIVALLKDVKTKWELELQAVTRERDDARDLALEREEKLTAAQKLLKLRKEELAKLQANLEKWLAIQQKTEKELKGSQKANVELIAWLFLSDKVQERLDAQYQNAQDQLILKKEELAELKTKLEKWLADAQSLKQELKGRQKANVQLIAWLFLSDKVVTGLDANHEIARNELALKKEELAKLQANLEKWLAVQQKTKKELEGSQKANVELIAWLFLSEKVQEKLDAQRLDALDQLTLKKEELAKLKTDLEKWLADAQSLKKELKGSQTANVQLMAWLFLSDKVVTGLDSNFEIARRQLTLKEEELARLKSDLEKWTQAQQKTNEKLKGSQQANVELIARLFLSDQALTALDVQRENSETKLTLKKEELAKLQTDLEKWLGVLQKIEGNLKGSQKANVELIARLFLTDRIVTGLGANYETSQGQLTLAKEELARVESDLKKWMADKQAINNKLIGTQQVNAELIARLLLAGKIENHLDAEYENTLALLALKKSELANVESDLKKWMADKQGIHKNLIGSQKANIELIARLLLAEHIQGGLDANYKLTEDQLLLKKEELARVESDLRKWMADKQGIDKKWVGSQKANVELIARLLLAEHVLNGLDSNYGTTQDQLNLTKEEAARLKTDLQKWLAVLQKTETDLKGAQKANADLLARLALRDDSLKGLRTQLDKSQKDSFLKEKDLARLKAELEKSLATFEATIVKLIDTKKDNDDLKSKLADAEKNLAIARTGLSKTQMDLATVSKRVKEQDTLVKLSQEDLGKLQKLFDSLDKANKSAQTELKLAELTLRIREQDLEKARTELAVIVTTRDKLAQEIGAGKKRLSQARDDVITAVIDRDQYKLLLDLKDKELATVAERIKGEREQRFEGIPLTGANVIFLVDMSGSMAIKDAKKFEPDPQKWEFVCETLGKLMKSIPTMQRFQVILFSDSTSYLFGNRDTWFKYDGPATAQDTRDALLKIKADGGTNMYAAFNEAFRYRKSKLDTIYLISDGLPSLSKDIPANIKEDQLSRFIRDKLKNEWNKSEAGLNDVRINTIGIYFESPEVGAFLWALAREHKGNFVGLR